MGLILGPGSSLGGRNGNPSILDREVLRTEDPGGLQSCGHKRVLHSLVTKQQAIFPFYPLPFGKHIKSN